MMMNSRMGFAAIKANILSWIMTLKILNIVITMCIMKSANILLLECSLFPLLQKKLFTD